MLATLYGALTHLILGGDGRRLLICILTAWVGFALGQAVGQVAVITFLAIGRINLLTGSLGALTALVLLYVLVLRPRGFRGRR
jgi:hypothetical protein